VAEHASAGDKKAMDRELQRLEKFADPLAVYNSYRAIENTWASRNFVKKPGKDAAPEEIAEYHKALGVPETPDGYFENLKLDDGLVLGDLDKPVAMAFAEHIHKAGATPQVANAALSWFLRAQEQRMAEMDESDDTFRVDAERALKDELGGAYKRKINAIGSLFNTAAGGADVQNENSVMARLLGGRTADGKKIGDDPDVVRWFVNLVHEINPAMAVVEDGGRGAGQSLDDEIKKIEGIMRTDRRTYDKEYAARYGELLSIREKIGGKKS
jgi:hypothetical protein